MLTSVVRSVAVTALTTACAIVIPAAASAGQGHRCPAPTVTATTQKVINLPGKGGHGDVVVADPHAHSVYLAQSPDNNVVVINTDTNTIRAVIPDIASANGIAYSRRYVFVAEATTNEVAIIAKSNWQVVATVASGGTEPDAVYYDPVDDRVLVANDGSNTMESFAASARFTLRGQLPLMPSPSTSGPDLGTYSPAGDVVYQADDNDVLVISARRLAIERVMPLALPAGAAAKDMYLDYRTGLLWVATTSTEIVAINPYDGRIEHTVSTASGIDEVAADPDQGLLFLGESGAGVLGVVDLTTDTNIANIPTEAGFHTEDYLPHTRLVYAYLNKSNTVDIDKISLNRFGWADKNR